METTTGQAGQASRAVQAAAVPSQVDVPPVEMEDPGETEKVSDLQDLWLQLQEAGLGPKSDAVSAACELLRDHCFVCVFCFFIIHENIIFENACDCINKQTD